jgi:hypothetical protein
LYDDVGSIAELDDVVAVAKREIAASAGDVGCGDGLVPIAAKYLVASGA